MALAQLPIPPHFDPGKTGEVWRVEYQKLAASAKQWALKHRIRPAAEDKFMVGLLLVDVQNTFCIPGFELFVGGRSGTGAVDDNRRLGRFIYRNLGGITRIFPTLDTHHALQIFHPIFFVDADARHPDPFTRITARDVREGVWKFNPAMGPALGVETDQGQRHLVHYVETLEKSRKYDLTVWPYHAMLGGIGHSLVASVEEAVFFHSIARVNRPEFQVKGDRAFTENYSALNPEVTKNADGQAIGEKNTAFLERLLSFDVLVVAGQAKSHCVVWTLDDLLKGILEKNPLLAEKVYLLEDCTSPVVIPGGIDYTEEADAAFDRFSQAGMHIVQSTDPIATWPGIDVK